MGTYTLKQKIYKISNFQLLYIQTLLYNMIKIQIDNWK